MSIFYNIDFSLASRRLLPPAKRSPVMLSWMKALLEPLQWLRDMHFEFYLNGVARDKAPFYYSADSYLQGDWVVGSDDRVYENISSGSISGIDPIKHPENWLVVLETYIGLNDRLRYNSETMVLEYILNKKFRIRPVDYNGGDDEPQIYVDNTDDDLDNVYFFRADESYQGIFFDRKEPYAEDEENNIEYIYGDIFPYPLFSSELKALLLDYDPTPTFMFNQKEYLSTFDYIVFVPEVYKTYHHFPLPTVEPLLTPTEVADLLKTIVRTETMKYNLAGIVFDVRFYTPPPPPPPGP